MEFIIAQIIGVIGAGLAMVAAQMKDKKKISNMVSNIFRNSNIDRKYYYI